MSLPERIPLSGAQVKTATFALRGGLFEAQAALYQDGRRVRSATVIGPTRYGARLQALQEVRRA